VQQQVRFAPLHRKSPLSQAQQPVMTTSDNTVTIQPTRLGGLLP
jgi:hypothetical protein